MIRMASASPADVEQFQSEFAIMAKLSHPNVARIYDFDQIRDRDEHLFTLELVEGQSIKDACQSAEWPAIVSAVAQRSVLRGFESLRGAAVDGV